MPLLEKRKTSIGETRSVNFYCQVKGGNILNSFDCCGMDNFEIFFWMLVLRSVAGSDVELPVEASFCS